MANLTETQLADEIESVGMEANEGNRDRCVELLRELSRLRLALSAAERERDEKAELTESAYRVFQKRADAFGSSRRSRTTSAIASTAMANTSV